MHICKELKSVYTYIHIYVNMTVDDVSLRFQGLLKEKVLLRHLNTQKMPLINILRKNTDIFDFSPEGDLCADFIGGAVFFK